MKENKSSLFHRRLDYRYPVITHGKGIYLFGKGGDKYIDAVGGAFAANLGHGIEEIAGEIFAAAKKFSFLHGSQFTTDIIEEYANQLCQVAPRGLDKVLFASGGSEAVETAIKLARQYHYDSGRKSKHKIIFTWPSYHGATLGALSVTGKAGAREIYQPWLIKFPYIPASFCYRCFYGRTYPGCNLKCARELEAVIKKEKPDTAAAFIVEPVIGSAAGAVVPPPEYFPIVRKICGKYNIVLIFDEIMCGFGRTGKWFASEHWGCSADMAILGKGLSAGIVPLAAVLCSGKIFRAIKSGTGNFIHGFTFMNNPFSAAVGKAVLGYIKKNGLVAGCAKKGGYLLSKLNSLSKFDIVGDIRGLGLLTAVEFVKDKDTKEAFPRQYHLSERLLQLALKKGLNLYFATGFCQDGRGDAVLVGPPYNVKTEEIDEIIRIFSETISEIQGAL